MRETKEPLKIRARRFLKKWIAFFLNPRLLLCVGIAWMITNGWSYVFVMLGPLLHIHWMTVVGGAWLTILWFPFTPEKILTVCIAIFLLRLLFPNDKKTLEVLKTEFAEVKSKILRHRGKHENQNGERDR